ncbi:Imm26 family immunity protein [Bacillus mycoides]|uniref:Imm26 family immunity protein n=1 Tax=Bacillus mycoides TaxID=1405 RepID=UPI00077AB27C|nr:Imm26 family immunity protein [Bacillus mycoides]KXY47270.1 hypothetical protein AT257_02665 [Bacillus cereus]QEL85635.1 hypothetical protein DN409_15085 [Bacillus mycoides]
MSINYPFKPKSNRYLVPGQFWAIPLDNRKFVCGRVIEMEPNSRRGFLAGLMDWIGDSPPIAEDLKGCKTLIQLNVHIKTIHETALDGCISGYRSLKLDGIEEDYFTSQLVHDENCMLMKGYAVLRQATQEEADTYGQLGAAGYMMIKCYAEDLLASK